MQTLEGSLKNLRRVLEVVAENAATVRAIGRSPERDTLVAPVTEQAAVAALEMQPETQSVSGSDKLRRSLITHHFAHTQLIFFFWWVENDMAIPIDEMAEMIARLVIEPIWAAQSNS